MRLVLRFLSSRYGIALVLAVVVLAVVGVAKTFISSTAAKVPVGPVVSPVSTAPASDASLGDDSIDDPSSDDPRPSLSASGPKASVVASRFIAAWLKHDGVSGDDWRATLRPNATDGLMAKLAATDPADVPADQVTGAITVEEQGAVDQATVPVNGGKVELRLVATAGRWKVDGIDWNPS
jgi:hypothetical protein